MLRATEHGGELYKAMIFKNLFFESNNKAPNQILFHSTTTFSRIVTILYHIARTLWRLQNSFEYIMWIDAHNLPLQLSSTHFSLTEIMIRQSNPNSPPSSCAHTVQILPSTGLSKSYCGFKIKLEIQLSLKCLLWWAIKRSPAFCCRQWQVAHSIQVVTWLNIASFSSVLVWFKNHPEFSCKTLSSWL